MTWNDKPAGAGWTASILSGAVLWRAVCLAAGVHAAWDSPLFPVVYLPVSIATGMLIGYTYPGRPWRWAIAFVCGPFVLHLLSGYSYRLLPLSMLVFIALSMPVWAASSIGSYFGARRPVDEGYEQFESPVAAADPTWKSDD